MKEKEPENEITVLEEMFNDYSDRAMGHDDPHVKELAFAAFTAGVLTTCMVLRQAKNMGQVEAIVTNLVKEGQQMALEHMKDALTRMESHGN